MSWEVEFAFGVRFTPHCILHYFLCLAITICRIESIIIYRWVLRLPATQKTAKLLLSRHPKQRPPAPNPEHAWTWELLGRRLHTNMIHWKHWGKTGWRLNPYGTNPSCYQRQPDSWTKKKLTHLTWNSENAKLLTNTQILHHLHAHWHGQVAHWMLKYKTVCSRTRGQQTHHVRPRWTQRKWYRDRSKCC
jgi:hypothetical protein